MVCLVIPQYEYLNLCSRAVLILTSYGALRINPCLSYFQFMIVKHRYNVEYNSNTL